MGLDRATEGTRCELRSVIWILATTAIPATLGWSQEIEVVRTADLPPEVRAWRASLPEGRPALRGFRAPVLDHRDETVPIELPRDAAARRAAGLVARDLAHKGLLSSTVAAIDALRSAGAEVGPSELRAIGLPVDWLEYFHGPGGDSVVRQIAARLASGSSAADLETELAGYSFTFRPTLAGFRVAAESGEHEIDTVRLQLTSGTYWQGMEDGGSLDLLRQLLDVLPEARFVASIQEVHLEELLETSRGWPRSWTVIPEALPVAQWAQDCGKPGLAPASSGEGYEAVTMVPRYASRGEDGATLVPGETFLADGFASAGLRAVQSPLLFQGGDLLAARDPSDGARILFVGEANVWRNTALGLTNEQVVEAFRVEFGVDRCVVLPAVSFHIDQELTLRSVGGRLIACAADPAAAVKIVLSCGLDPMERAGALDSASAARARADLEAGRDRQFLENVLPAARALELGFGRFPESFSKDFSRGEADSGTGNLQLFLLALDLLVSWTLPVDELPLDPHSVAYLRSFRRRDEDRRVMIERIRAAGPEIALIPSLPEGNRGIDYLNGVQEPKRYLMPAWGGLFEPLDRAAEAAFRAAFGPGIDVRPILTSESQRRGGGVHCSISVLPGR